MTVKRGGKGRFVRTRYLWDGSDWDDGYIDNKGRFRIYRPDYPRAYALGYVLRSHVVWWLHHGICHPKGTNLHHKNHNKLDDRIENLELLLAGDHVRHHCAKIGVQFICRNCKQSFYVPTWRVKERRTEGNTIKFCSQKCYHAAGRTESHKTNISAGLRRRYATRV